MGRGSAFRAYASGRIEKYDEICEVPIVQLEKVTSALSVSRRIAMIRLQLPCKHQSGGFRPDVQQVACASRNKRVE